MGNKRMGPSSEHVIQEVLKEWLPRHRRLAHPLLDLTLETDVVPEFAVSP